MKNRFIFYLLRDKSTITKKWLDEIMSFYPSATVDFMKTNKDPLLNPVGDALTSLVDKLYTYFTADKLYDIKSVLVNAIKILVVQNIEPSRCLGFINVIKQLVRVEFKEALDKENLFSELLIFESRVDEVLLQAMDIYVANLTKLYEIKANDIKSRTFKLLRMANIEDEARSLMMDINCKGK
jgi:hypothetical protein